MSDILDHFWKKFNMFFCPVKGRKLKKSTGFLLPGHVQNCPMPFTQIHWDMEILYSTINR